MGFKVLSVEIIKVRILQILRFNAGLVTNFEVSDQVLTLFNDQFS